MNREGGVALITVMMVTVLVTTAAVTLASRQRLEVNRVAMQFERHARDQIIAELDHRARVALRNDLRGSGHDATTESWATERLYVSVDGITATGKITDQQALFNLNNLAVRPGENRRRRRTSAAPRHSAASDSSQFRLPQAPTGPGSADFASPIENSSTGPRRNVSSNDSADATPAASPAPGTMMVPTTRSVLDANVARALRGRARPSDFANLGDLSAFRRDISEMIAVEATEESDSGPAKIDSVPKPLARSDFGAPPLVDAPGSTQSRQAVTPDVETNFGVPALSSSGTPPSTGSRRAISSQAARIDQDAAAQFTQLLTHLNIDTAIVQPILDWIDADSDVRFPNGAEDDYYSKLDPGYRPANRIFSDVSELLLVKGVTPEIYQTLRPFVVALPEYTPVNVNTAPREILMSLSPEIDTTVAELLVNSREAQPFVTLEQLDAHPALAAWGLSLSSIDVGSEYFALSATVTQARMTQHVQVLIGRGTGGDVRTMRQTTGWFEDE